MDEEAVGRWRPQFPILSRLLYFNSCSLGAMPLVAEQAVHRFLELWASKGAAAWYEDWWAELESLRAVYAGLIGADRDEVALHPNVSSALTAVAGALDHGERPGVVMSELEFPTAGHQWLTRQRGVEPVEVRFAASDGIGVPLATYDQLVDQRTALLVSSHVHYTTGHRQDLAAMAALAHERGARLLVDAYQSVGSMPVDVHADGVDFLVGGSLKWLLGGPGMAFLYVRRDLAEKLMPRSPGWWADAHPFDFEARRFEPAPGALRFQGGTLSVGAGYAARAGAELIAEVGVESVQRRIEMLTSRIIANAQAAGYRVLSELDPAKRGGIVTLEVAEPRATVAELGRREVVVDYRPGRIRLSPHFYNTPAEVDALFFELAAMQDLARAGKLKTPTTGVGAAPVGQEG